MIKIIVYGKEIDVPRTLLGDAVRHGAA